MGLKQRFVLFVFGVLWHINFYMLSNAKSIFIQKQFYFKPFTLELVCSLNLKTVLFETIQFNISTQFSSISPKDRTRSVATTPSQSGSGSNSNEGVLYILQSSSITGTLPLDCLMVYLGQSLGGGALLLCREAVGVFYSPSRLGNKSME